jgi:DNA-binding CsgD family transcriptional regulator
VFQEELVGARGRLRIARDDLHGALEDLLRCQRMLGKYDNRRPAEWRADAVTALLALGERDRAVRLACDGLDPARRFGAPRALCRALRSAGTAIGGAEGLELLEEAVAVGTGSAARLEAAYAQADLGRQLVDQRRRREGREILSAALPTALECGASALADRIRGDLGAGGGRPARLERSGIDALTPAERRTCDLATSGLGNREVAQTLFVTERTVELHLTNAYRKLGIRSRHQLPSVLPPPTASE